MKPFPSAFIILTTLLVFCSCTEGWVSPVSHKDTWAPSHRKTPIGLVGGFEKQRQPLSSSGTTTAIHHRSTDKNNGEIRETYFSLSIPEMMNRLKTSVLSAVLSVGLGTAALTQLPAPSVATDSGAIVSCLFEKCAVPLGKCIANPKCLANVICINTCNNRPDEVECQIECGNLWENDVVGEFNKCAVSDMSCVPQQPDDGSYPVPNNSQVVPKFDTKLWNGRWYITAGQNPLFDTFPCQVHFFTETEPGKFFAKLNWRVEEPDGEFFTRDALQEFYQDPDQPSHLINHDNEYLHYKDDWWIIDYEYDDNPTNTPPFAFVYYRGSNDAWDGYGGVVVYTRDAALPESLVPRLRTAAKKVGFDFDKDFAITDNSCPAELSTEQRTILREKFAGKVILQSEKQLQAQATLLRGNAANSAKAQRIFFEDRVESARKAFQQLENNVVEFEKEIVNQATAGGSGPNSGNNNK